MGFIIIINVNLCFIFNIYNSMGLWIKVKPGYNNLINLIETGFLEKFECESNFFIALKK